MYMSGREEPTETGPDFAAVPTHGAAEGFIFEQLRSGLHHYLLRQLRRPDDVEDLTQEVYLRLLRFAATQSIRFPKAYVLRVAFNVLYEFKHRVRQQKVDFDSVTADRAIEHLADEAMSPDDSYDRERRQERIERLAAKLSPMQRAVLIMATRENLSYEEIGKSLQISASTARVHLFRATTFLRQEMAKE